MDIRKIIFIYLISGCALQNAYGTFLTSDAVASAPDTPSQQEKQCEVSASNGGQFELGRIPNGQIKPNQETRLPPQKMVWTISCTQETYLSLQAQDNQRNSSTGSQSWQFGLGHVNGNGKIGYFEAWLHSPQVDSKESSFLREGKTTSTHSAAMGDYLLTWVERHSRAPASGKVFSTEIEIRPVLASLSTMKGPVTDMTNIEGLVTIHFAFGI